MNHILPEPAFVPLGNAARRLGVPLAWLRDEAEQGRVPSILCGRRFMFDVAVVAESLRNRATQAVPTVVDRVPPTVVATEQVLSHG
jgi:hypothetical protein